VVLYLVEAHVSGPEALSTSAARRRARAAVRTLEKEGVALRYVRTTLVPGDETCFHVFEADSVDAVARACRIAELTAARIVPALE
jgi:muconolactone delta-isomerase